MRMELLAFDRDTPCPACGIRVEIGGVCRARHRDSATHGSAEAPAPHLHVACPGCGWAGYMRTASDAAPGAPPEVTVYGSTSCEDTAITRSRLSALGVPFRDVDIDTDAAGMARVLALEDRRVTPTLVIGEAETVVAEPSMAQLDVLLAKTGHRVDPPLATQLHGSLTDRPIPTRTLPSAWGSPFSLEQTRGRTQAAVFFAHAADCLACRGYAGQLRAELTAMEDAGAAPLVVVNDEIGAARGWSPELPGVRILADADGAWKEAVARAIGVAPVQVMLLVLDRYGAPRATSLADEAGGLTVPSEATAWLRYLILECPECSGELPWPE